MTVAEHSPDVRPRTDDGRNIQTERVDGGVLVFAKTVEYRAHLDGEAEVGAELIGFADVESVSLLRRSVAQRGLSHGAVDHLPRYEPEEVGL